MSRSRTSRTGRRRGTQKRQVADDLWRLPDVPLPQFVLRHAAALGEKLALVDAASGRGLTYAQLLDGVCRLAGGLRARGVQPGDFDHRGGQIDGRHPCAGARKAFCEQTATAANIRNGGARQSAAFRDEGDAHRVQDVQRPKLALLVPEAMGDRIELCDLCLIGLKGGGIGVVGWSHGRPWEATNQGWPMVLFRTRFRMKIATVE